MKKANFPQHGFGLIELMISMALGMFLVSGAISVFIASKQSYSLNSEMGWIQDNVRFASSTLNKDLRMAGFFGCGANTSIVSTLNTVSGSQWYVDFDKAVSGWDGDDAGYPTPEFPAAFNSASAPGLPDSDLISLRRANDTDIKIDSHNPMSAVIHTVGNHPFERGDILVATDCSHTAIFQMAGNASNHVTHNTGGSTDPGNCTKQLGVTPCASGASNAKEFKKSEGAFIMSISAHAYYVAESDDGTPALFRRELGTSSSTATTSDDEIVQGVENLQVYYGLDTDSDSFANKYLEAADVPSANWGNVVAIRVHLLFRSLLQVTSQAQEFRFDGTTYTPTDRFLRQEVVSTIQLRNKG